MFWAWSHFSWAAAFAPFSRYKLPDAYTSRVCRCFIGEILVLIGAFKFNYWIAFFAAIGVILSACYSLWLYRRVVFGEITNDQIKSLKDLNKNEYLILTPLLIMILILGFYPALLLDLISSSAEKVSDNMLNYIKIVE